MVDRVVCPPVGEVEPLSDFDAVVGQHERIAETAKNTLVAETAKMPFLPKSAHESTGRRPGESWEESPGSVERGAG